jgi:hypothetical protein
MVRWRSVAGMLALALAACGRQARPPAPVSRVQALTVAVGYADALRDQHFDETLAQTVSLPALLRGAFGGAYDALPAARRKRLEAHVEDLWRRRTLPFWKSVAGHDTHVGKLETEAHGATRWAVRYRVKVEGRRTSPWFRADVARVRGALRVVDVGTPADTLGASLQEAWREGHAGKDPLAFLEETYLPQVRARRRATSLAHLRLIVQMLRQHALQHDDPPWPPCSGKAFVLWLVPSGDVGLKEPSSLDMLFSPEDPARAADFVATARWSGLTRQVLEAGTGLDALTSYVGRRNAAADARLPDDALQKATPIVADLHFGDVALVGWSDGHVAAVDRAGLGLAAGDPLVAGPASKSPLLRLLGGD